MSATRADLRIGIREKIQCWPDLATTLSAAITTSTVTTLSLMTLTGISDRALLEIDSEILQVIGVTNPATNPISVMRGQRGSTAATHSNGAAVNVYPFWGWTDQAINRYIEKAIDWLGESMVWTLVPLTNTWLSGNKEFGLPSNCSYPTGDIVKRVEFQDPQTGLYKQALGWTHILDRIILNQQILQNWNVRIWVQTRQAQLTDDSTQIDTRYAREALEFYASGRVLDELLANRSRYYDYSAALNDRASILDDLQRAAYYFFNQATIMADKISRPGLSGYAPIQRS